VTYLLSHGARVGALTGQHLALVLAALLVAVAIAGPIGIYATRHPRTGSWALAILGAIYTIPSLALLALFVRWFGIGFSPIFVALVIYAQFMIVRNIVTGLHGVDSAQVDAARGLGFSPRQSLRSVEIPLALPVMIGGVRVAAIAMIALAALGGYVGGGGLGVLIFEGLTLHNNGMIVAGSLAAALLAIAVDGALRLVERAAR
jgi:osmoprotectant transport system permease protein